MLESLVSKPGASVQIESILYIPGPQPRRYTALQGHIFVEQPIGSATTRARLLSVIHNQVLVADLHLQYSWGPPHPCANRPIMFNFHHRPVGDLFPASQCNRRKLSKQCSSGNKQNAIVFFISYGENSNTFPMKRLLRF